MRTFLRREPWLIAVIISFLLFGVYSLVEHVRAERYVREVAEFRQQQSTRAMLAVVNTIEQKSQTQLCDLTTSDTLTQSYEHTTLDALQELSVSIEQTNSPVFYSAGVYLPSVVEARELHGQITAAKVSLQKLSQPSTMLQYCASVAETLSNMWFLRELSTVEGISALQPNQLENYLVRFESAYTQFKAINRVPDAAGKVHKALNDHFVALGESLQGDDSNIEQFASDIEQHIEAVDQTLAALGEEAAATRELPEKLQRTAIPLRPQ